MSFYVLYSLHKCTFLYISTCARGRKHKCAISFIQQCIATRCFIPFSFISFSDSTVLSDGLTCFVSIESAILNESFDIQFKFIFYLFIYLFIYLFDMNDSVSRLLKHGLAATYWRVYCHIYLSMIDLNQLRCQHKNTFSKILFNYQY